jgi:hypothetical protein
LRKQEAIEAWEFCLIKADGWVALAGQMALGKKGATVSHLIYMNGNMDNDSNYEAGLIQFLDRKTMGRHRAQAIESLLTMGATWTFESDMSFL